MTAQRIKPCNPKQRTVTTKETNHEHCIVDHPRLLAALFLFAGVMKLIMPIEEMTKEIAMPGGFLRFIGVVEVLGAIGLILPWLLRFAQTSRRSPPPD